MRRSIGFISIVVMILVCMSTYAMAQVSADKRVKDAEAAQAKSWQQVDQINKQNDQTQARLHQSRQSAAPATNQGGYSVKKTEVGTVSPYSKKAKQQPQKKTDTPKQK